MAMPLGAYSKACRKLSSLARRVCCSRSKRTSARCISARSRALPMAIPACWLNIASASRPQAPGRLPLRGRSTDRTPSSSPPRLYIGANRQSSGCQASGCQSSAIHGSASSGTSPSTAWPPQLGISQELAQARSCGTKTRLPQDSPTFSSRSQSSRGPIWPSMLPMASSDSPDSPTSQTAATTRSPSGRTRFTAAAW